MVQVAGMEAVCGSSRMGSLLPIPQPLPLLSVQPINGRDRYNPYSIFEDIGQPVGGRLIITDYFRSGGEEETAIHAYCNSCLPAPSTGLLSLPVTPLQAHYPRTQECLTYQNGVPQNTVTDQGADLYQRRCNNECMTKESTSETTNIIAEKQPA